MFIAIKHLKENILKIDFILLTKQYSWHWVKMYPFQRQYWYKNIKYLPERKTNYACWRETRKWGFCVSVVRCSTVWNGLNFSLVMKMGRGSILTSQMVSSPMRNEMEHSFGFREPASDFLTGMWLAVKLLSTHWNKHFRTCLWPSGQ